MPFILLRFDAEDHAAEDWADALLAEGAFSVDVADANAGTADEIPLYGEPGTDSAGADGAMTRASSWAASRLTALFSDDANVASALTRAAAQLGCELPPYAQQEIADTDWVRQTQAQFQPTRISQRLWIVPSWCDPIDQSAINLRLDPGLAFGTGTHPTTRLCLQWLLAHLRAGDSVLDYGCGSGILAIAAAKLGALSVVGTDIDPQAIAAGRANASRNGVDIVWAAPDACPSGPFDVVVANILANPLRMLAPLLGERVLPDGAIVLSGVLEHQASDVIESYTPWFNMTAWGDDDGWIALAGSRNHHRR